MLEGGGGEWCRQAYLHFLDDLLAKGAHFSGATNGHVVVAFILTGDTVEGAWIIGQGGTQVGPEFNQEEGALRSLVVQLFEALLLRKLIVNLSNVYRLEHWIAMRGGRLADVHEKMLFSFIMHEGGKLNQAELVSGNRTALELWSKAIWEGASAIGTHKETVCTSSQLGLDVIVRLNSLCPKLGKTKERISLAAKWKVAGWWQRTGGV